MVGLLVVAVLAWALAYSDVIFRVPSLRRVRGQRSENQVDLGAYIAEVSARVRAGAAEAEAWARTAERHGLDPRLDGGQPRALSGTRAFAAGPTRGARAAAELSRELGAPLADMLDHYGTILAQVQVAADAATIALTGPRTSARLLALLPLAGVALGTAMGADPLGSILAGGPGTYSALVGLLLIGVGYMWSRALIERAAHQGDLDEALDAHLVAGALHTGVSIPRALTAVGNAGQRPELGEAGALLSVGAPWSEAWARRGLIARAIEPAWIDGANPIPLLEGAATGVLMRSDRLARVAAERLAVRLVIPVGLCYLPAFVLLGVVPVVISLSVSLM